jgi:soluble lytic murein transglycosylase-like protein
MANAQHISNQLQFLKRNVGMTPFNIASWRTGIDRNLLLAVASRESNMGMTLDNNYLGDSGYGMGLMQVDRRHHPQFAASVHPGDHSKIVLKGAQILKEEIKRFGGNEYAALAAYNTGASDVQYALRTGTDPDLFTTGKDYAKDTLSRYRLINQVAGNPIAGFDEITSFFFISALAGTSFLIVKEHKGW